VCLAFFIHFTVIYFILTTINLLPAPSYKPSACWEKITHTVIAISSYQQHELANIYKIVPREKIQLIYLGINLENYLKHAIAGRAAFRKFYLLKETDIAIGIVGRMVPVKNLDFFARVANQVLQK